MPKRAAASTEVPRAVQVQLARLFGADSKKAKQETRTPTQWKAVLREVVRELKNYIRANVDSDDLHVVMIDSGLFAAREALNEADFWPGYAEGITRALLLLLGDYPDHRR